MYKEIDMNRVNLLWNKISEKLEKTSEEIGVSFPYMTDNGEYKEYTYNGNISWWTNGFWSGMMWLMYIDTENKKYAEIAHGCEVKLDKAFLDFTGLHHDVGFMWILTALASYKLTNDEKSRARALHAATLLAGRFNTNGNFIRAWNGDLSGWAIIDCMMNIPILYWATEELGDPRFKAIAMREADMVMNAFVRPDGSVNHIVIFDAETGKVKETPAGQGYAAGSSWSRGQAWAIYGFILSYMYTKEQRYLDTAKKVARYVMANIDETGIPRLDYRAPLEPDYRDSTAGAISACGLIELAKYCDENERHIILKCVDKLIEGLEKCCDFSDEEQAIVGMGSEQYYRPETIHTHIIYGDYYLMEALLKLKGNDKIFW